MSKSRILIWDLPTRLFHWLVTVGLITCYAFAQFSDEHSPGFMIHMILGIVLGLIVALRVVWGVIGSRYARFNSFLFSPAKVLDYFRSAFTGKEEREHIGHNPGSSYGIFAMLFLLGMAAVSGLLMTGGNEFAEELHTASSYALLAVVAVHITGVIWYSIRHGENITLSMVTGTKFGEPSEAIPSNRPIAALVFIAVVAFVTVSLFQSFDRTKGQTKLPFLNTVITLGEAKESWGHDD